MDVIRIINLITLNINQEKAFHTTLRNTNNNKHLTECSIYIIMRYFYLISFFVLSPALKKHYKHMEYDLYRCEITGIISFI